MVPNSQFDLFSQEKQEDSGSWCMPMLIYSIFGHLQKRWMLAEAKFRPKSPLQPIHSEQGPNSKHSALGLQPTILSIRKWMFIGTHSPMGPLKIPLNIIRPPAGRWDGKIGKERSVRVYKANWQNAKNCGQGIPPPPQFFIVHCALAPLVTICIPMFFHWLLCSV